MELHEDIDAFEELVATAAETIGLPQIFIEKDYWVTKVLKYLSDSQYADEVVFKGGTALSKAHKLIERFSEDIDLAIFSEGKGDSRRKKQLKSVEITVTQNLTFLEDDERNSKGSNIRKTVYQYPRHIDGSDFGQASPELIVEINAFTKPEPFDPCILQTLIAEVLKEQECDDLIEKFGLKSFSVNVLSVRRTLVEKILGVIKDSYHDDPVSQLSKRIRHLYDICLILKRDEYRKFLAGDDFKGLCDACLEDERKGYFNYSDCFEKPLVEAPIFEQLSEWSDSLSTTYNGNFKDLVYGELPAMEDIQETIDFVKKCLQAL